ncbi:FkbM family methyltransferase [Pseudolabrys taiwanensis]|uniref:FkbM family methyltransferase n=1 Tax=Pseudolabrys taiwanensis TaxID=331696 RepID=A0A345ZXX2_9HYPH|nr:FkbM family methyltransferase [Pseudolabrys taiwanensis]AXK81769.1 FkbM family methyltransferase [Pseudolabrys taiwanensis]
MIEALPPINVGQLGDALLKHLLGTDTPVILEIGANDGSHTVQFVDLFPKATVYAFEPDPRALAKFKARGQHPGVHLFEVALGRIDGEADFHVSSGAPEGPPEKIAERYPQGWDQSGSLKAPRNHIAAFPWVKFENTIKIPTRSLDAWAREHGIGTVDLIWADVQGAEGDLIAGGSETLAQTRYFYTEYSNDEMYEGQPSLAQLVDMLPSFSIFRRYQWDVLFENTTMNSN